MELINNRYRVIRVLEQNYQLTSYLVVDVIRGHRYLCFNVLNIDNISTNIVEFFNNEFLRLKNLNNPGIVNLVQYGFITTIDNRNLKDYKYFYSTEYNEGNLDVLHNNSNLSYDEKLNLFMELCKAVNNLHLKGCYYGNIKPDNICFLKDKEDKVKLKDLATTYIESLDFWKSNVGDIYYRAPELRHNSSPTVASDIYSLGMIFMKLFNLEACLTSSQRTYEKKSSSGMAEVEEKLLRLLEKMINRAPENRYASINELINIVNDQFITNYKPFDISAIEKLSLGSKLIGREYPKQQIFKVYEEMIKLQQCRFIGIHGESGIGKTRFLKEMQHLFKMAKVKVYTALLTETGNESGKSATDILRKMISECDDGLLKRYEQELVRFIPELAGNKQIEVSSTSLHDKERFRTINRLSSFISDFSQDRPLVVIVDNIHFASSFFLELIEYAYSDNLKNLIFIFSYDDVDYSENGRFDKMITRLRNRMDFLNLKLNPLNDIETVEMVKSILSMPTVPERFGRRIYSHTYGNPLFIEEVVKKLFATREIYINEVSGRWSTDYDIENMSIPSDMEQAMLNQIKELNGEYIKLLDAISIFNSAVNTLIISNIADCNLEKTEELINELVRKGILMQKIDDRGFVFEIYNKVLKKMIYSGLEGGERIKMHESAALLLEELTEYEDREYKEELIYHLEMSGNRDKIIKYCIENADRFEKLNIREAAIRNIEKAVSMFDNCESQVILAQLLMRLGNIHKQNGNIETAIEIYKRAEKIGNSLNEYTYSVDALNEIAGIYFDKYEMDKSLDYLIRAEKILSEFNYTKGLLEAKSTRAYIYERKQEYSDSFRLCNELITMCGDKYLHIKGKLLNILGNLYIGTGDIERAMESFGESIRCYEEVNYLEGTLKPLNNIGVIYTDYHQDDDKAIECFAKMKEISERHNYIDSELSAYVNIGCVYYSNWQYEEALIWFKDALAKAEKHYFEGIVFYSYLYLSNLYLLLSDYKNAYKFFESANRELLEHPDQGRALADYYRMGASLLYQFGEIQAARSFIKKALEKHSSDESVLKLSCEVINYHIELTSANDEQQVRSIIDDIEKVAAGFAKKENKLNVIYDTAIVAYEKGYSDIARHVLGWIKDEVKEQRIELKKYYIEGALSRRTDSISLLNNALDVAVKLKDKTMQWKIYSSIGDYYSNKKNYFYAVNFYFDACEVIRDMVLSIPENNRIEFLNFHGMSKPFYKLFLLKQHYNKEYGKQSLTFERINSIKEMDKLFEYVELRDILTNKYFIRSAQKIFDSQFENEIKSLKDIATHLYSDSLKNLELIINYLARLTLARQAFIIREENDRKTTILASITNDAENNINSHIIDKVRSTKEPLVIIGRLEKDDVRIDKNYSDSKSVICVPVVVKRSDEDTEIVEERRNSMSGFNELVGYIYLQSDKILNNFSGKTLNKCSELAPLIGLLLEHHALKISSSIDKLTGTLTRKFLEDSLERQITASFTGEKSFSIIIFDLDNFKSINDSFGHQTGDKVLKELCSTVLKNIRRIDTCGRYGGEEFIIILPDTDTNGAQILAEKLRQKVVERRILGDKRPVTVSMGIASYPIHGLTSQELIEKADQALYIAKEKGKNRYQVWEKEFYGKVKGTDKLSGIISGNAVQDYRNVSVMIDLIELIKNDAEIENKIYDLLGRIIEITEAQQGIFFILENEKISQKFARRIFQEDWIEPESYSASIINKVIESKQGVYMIDWDEVLQYDYITGMPDWKSVAAVPIIKSGCVKGVLYLSVSTKVKEFKFDDFNFINILAQMAVALL